MVHLESVLGAEALEIVLRGMGDLADLPIAVFVLDPDHQDQLVQYIRPRSATGEPYKSSEFCRHLHRLPGGEALCRQCDSHWGWRIFDERWTTVQRYKCHMGLSEFGLTVEAGGDLMDPIVWGQVRVAGDSVNEHIHSLRGRAEQVLPGAAAQIADENLRRLLSLSVNVPAINRRQADDLCTRLTAGVRGLQHILQTEHYIARTLHRIKSSLSQSRGAADRLIPLVNSADGVRYLVPHPLRETMRERVRRIEEGVEGATLAIDEFERSRRMSAGSIREISPNWHPLRELLERGARRIRAEAEGRHIEVRVHGSAEESLKRCYVYVDWEGMLELFDLLLDNALKYSWSGTREKTRRIDITWQTGIRAPDNLPAGQRPLEDGEWLEISIEDFGLQIHPDDRDTIFLPGARGRLFDPRRSITGAGMGLGIALDIVRHHDGYLSVWCPLLESANPLGDTQSGQEAAPPGKVVVSVGLPRARWNWGRP